MDMKDNATCLSPLLLAQMTRNRWISASCHFLLSVVVMVMVMVMVKMVMVMEQGHGHGFTHRCLIDRKREEHECSYDHIKRSLLLHNALRSTFQLSASICFSCMIRENTPPHVVNDCATISN